MNNLIENCSPGFDHKKTLEPFDLLFQKAGKIRELQLQEALIKKHFANHSLKEYRQGLKKMRLKEQKDYFSMLDKHMIRNLKDSFKEIKNFLSELKTEVVNAYMEEKKKAIGKLLSSDRLQKENLHELRKQIKTYHYTQMSIDYKNIKQTKKDVLPLLLGKWHDCQILIKNLDKEDLTTKQLIPLEKFKTKINTESESLYDKILSSIPQSEFYKK